MSTKAMWPYLASTMAVALPLRMLKITIGSTLLRGLYVFLVPEDGSQVANQQLAQLSRKQQKKLEKAKKHQVALGGAENLMMYTVSPSYLESLPSFQQLENALMFMFMFIVNLIFTIVGQKYLGMPSNPLVQPWAALIIITLFAGLLEVELFSSWTLPSEKVVILATGGVSLVTSGLLLLLGPKYVLDFKVEEATKQLGSALHLLLKKVNPELGGELDTVKLEPLVVTLLLAHGAGILGAMLLTAAMRYAKLLLLASNPPAWGQQYFSTGLVMKAMLGLSLLLPCASVVVWVQPFMAVLGISDSTVELLKPLLVVVSGLLHLLVFRKLMQAFFTSALTEWWAAKHAASNEGDVMASQRMRARNTFINTILPSKVALQLAAPAIVFLGLGSLLLLQQLPLGGAASEGGSSGGVGVFISSCAGFLCCWSSCFWFLVTSLTVTFGRLGFMSLHAF